MTNANVFYAKPAEQALLGTISKELTTGWEIQTEQFEFQDTPLHRKARVELLKFSDPGLKAVQERLQAATSAKEFGEIAGSIDVSTMKNTDMAELMFALGPDVLSAMIEAMIPAAKTVQDMQTVAGFSQTRHHILESLQ